jgi:hypothetical protein
MNSIGFAVFAIAAVIAGGGLEVPADGPAIFGIAGVRLGATADRLRSALGAAGYRIGTVLDAISFAEKAKMVADNHSRAAPRIARKRSSVGRIEANGPHGEHDKLQRSGDAEAGRLRAAGGRCPCRNELPQHVRSAGHAPLDESPRRRGTSGRLNLKARDTPEVSRLDNALVRPLIASSPLWTIARRSRCCLRQFKSASD